MIQQIKRKLDRIIEYYLEKYSPILHHKSGLIISYTCTTSIATKIFNHKHVWKDRNIDYFKS
jgi:hypothetical protein